MSETPVKLTSQCLALVQRCIQQSHQDLHKQKSFQPFMLVSGPQKDGERIDLASANPDSALEQASEILSPGDGAISMYVVVLDGYTEIDGQQTDCLLLEAGQTGLKQALQLMQPYQREEGGIKLLEGPFAIQNLPTRLRLSRQTEAELKQSMQPLFLAPYTIFACMSEGQENPPQEHLQQFQSSLAEGIRHPHPLVSACVQQSLDGVQEMSRIIASEEFDVAEEIGVLAKLLDNEFKAPDAKQYKRFLVELAKTLAHSPEQQETINYIERTLG